MQSDVILMVDNLCKSFGPTRALVDVSIEVKRGEIRGLIGENGSGKSTLASIIAGIQKADSGSMYFNGREHSPSTLIEANRNGVSMVVQERGTVAMVTVAANVFIGKENLFTKYGMLNIKRLYTETSKILDDIKAPYIKPDMIIDMLTFEDRKLVEIARAMYSKPKLLIIDETTTALAKRGREILYSIIKRMRDEGLSVLFISHDIDEIVTVCDSVTILRDGYIVETLDKSELEPNRLKQLMVGREISENFYRSDYKCSHSEEVVLETKGISYGILKSVSIKLHKGEILGIGGLTECGMHELGKIMFGLIKPDRGSVWTGKGRKIDSTTTAIHCRIGYLSKNRDTEAIMLSASIRDNICLPSLDKLKKYGIILKRLEKEFVAKYVQELNIKISSLDQHCRYLSGGNKQKVIIGKWLGNESDILILDCPTRGIDVGVKASVYKLLTELKEQGKAIIMISEELSELIGMSDRIALFKDGVISGEFERNETLSEFEIIKYMI